MSCQAAGPLGAQAANTVLSRIAGTEPAVIDQAFVGSCISLGRRAATIQLARKDDTAVNFYIGGRLGASIKEAVCKGTLWGIRREARKPGSTFWLKGGKRPEQPVFAVVTQRGHGRPDRPARRRRACRAVHPSAAAAVHDRLRDPRFGNRIRRRAAGQLSALGRSGPRDGARHQVVSGAAGDPSGAQRAAGRRPPSRGLHRPVAARTAAARRARRLGRRRARRVGVDGDAGAARDAQPRRAGGVRAARGVRLRLRRNRRRGWQIRGDGAPGGTPRPRACARAAQAVRARRRRADRRRSPSSS